MDSNLPDRLEFDCYYYLTVSKVSEWTSDSMSITWGNDAGCQRASILLWLTLVGYSTSYGVGGLIIGSLDYL